MGRLDDTFVYVCVTADRRRQAEPGVSGVEKHDARCGEGKPVDRAVEAECGAGLTDESAYCLLGYSER
jgi:hypothetical protein